jgi:serine/threonine protein kinase
MSDSCPPHLNNRLLKQQGDSIGPYVVHSLLGAGMEGLVYRAFHLSGELCTVKLLRGRHMQREAEHTARYYKKLVGVVQVKQFREWGIIRKQNAVGERCWLAFDFIPGVPLPQHFRLTSQQPMDLVRQLLQLVCEVHDRGVGVGDLDHGRNLIVQSSGRLVLCDADAGVPGAMNRDRRADLEEVATVCRLMFRLRRLPMEPQLAQALDRSRSVRDVLIRLGRWLPEA